MSPRILLPLTLALGLPGCILVFIDRDDPPPAGKSPLPVPGADDTGWIACTEIAVASVMVSVVDVDGTPVSADEVWYRADEGPVQQAECMDELCSTWVAGWEVSGSLKVGASRSEPTEDPGCWRVGDANTTVEVPLTEDGCHVVTQEVDLVVALDEVICEDE